MYFLYCGFNFFLICDSNLKKTFMKKLLVLGAVIIGSVVSAFTFRTSCNIVFQIDGPSDNI